MMFTTCPDCKTRYPISYLMNASRPCPDCRRSLDTTTERRNCMPVPPPEYDIDKEIAEKAAAAVKTHGHHFSGVPDGCVGKPITLEEVREELERIGRSSRDATAQHELLEIAAKLPQKPKPDIARNCADAYTRWGDSHVENMRAALRFARKFWGLPPLPELEEKP